MEKRNNRACSSRLSSVQFFGFIKGWDQCAFLNRRRLKLIALVRGSKNLPVLQLLKKKFDAPEGALFQNKWRGSRSPQSQEK